MRLSSLAEYLRARGHSVTVLTAMPSYPVGRIAPGYGGVLRREQLRGVDVVRTFVYPTQSAKMLFRLANYFSFVGSSAMMGSFLTGGFDYLLVESPPLFLGLSALWLSWLKSARMIFNVSDLWPESAVHVGVLRRESFAFRISAALEKLFYRKAWLVAGQSKTIISDINRRFPGISTFHFSNGVDTEIFRPERRSDEARQRLGGKKQFVLAYAGLHGLAQGLEQVLEAFARMESQPAVQGVLIGDGPQKPALMARARELGLKNITFCDPCPATHIPELLASADAVLVPLKGHIPGAVPSKLYEAMACARPVILVGEGEAAEIVRESHAGFCVTPGDIGGLVQAMQQLQGDPDLRNQMGRNGRLFVLQHFDRKQILDGFVNFLEARADSSYLSAEQKGPACASLPS